MSVVCRPARAQDLEFANTLVVSSINHLTEQHGFGTMAISSPPRFQSFSLNDDADGLWVAEEDGRILGFAWSWVSGGTLGFNLYDGNDWVGYAYVDSGGHIGP